MLTKLTIAEPHCTAILCCAAGIQFILYALFGNNMIAFSFLLSCIFTSSRTATVFAYLLVFGSGLVGSLLLSQLANAGLWYADLLEFTPSLALYRYESGCYGCCCCWWCKTVFCASKQHSLTLAHQVVTCSTGVNTARCAPAGASMS
jgi:hypothetical protein